MLCFTHLNLHIYCQYHNSYPNECKIVKIHVSKRTTSPIIVLLPFKLLIIYISHYPKINQINLSESFL